MENKEKKDLNEIEEKNEKIDSSNENRERKKKKLLLLFLLLLVTGILVGTSTYAWFTANKTVAVNDISVNVAAQNGIQISVDGTSWKSIVQTTDLLNASAKYSAAVNQIPSTTNSIVPVSTVGNINTNGRMEMFAGDVKTDADSGDYILTATQENEANGTTGSFIAFDLFFKVDEDTPVWITPNSGVTTSDVNDTGIKNATRMAFVMLGNTAAGSDLATIQALNAGTSATKYIWEPNYDVHTAAGVSNAYDTYGITTTQTGGSLLPYSGVKAAIAEENKVFLKVAAPATHATTYGTYFDAVTPNFQTVEGFDANFSAFTFTKGITKVRVYMWVEGQDVDCENGASGGNVTYSLQITSENA
ncbi:MAG: hypothetical protein ACI31R_04420 [Bacilli bacterium]